MAKTVISISELGDAIAEELALYGAEVVEALNAIGEDAAETFVQLAQESAPKRTGEYAKSLTYVVEERSVTGDKTFICGAKAPHYRLTHLLVNGHPTADGGRVPGNPFLQNALEAVLPEYEQNVEEALKK